jgi:dTDP-4-amino-4,6-dideoxygalactose transaminase
MRREAPGTGPLAILGGTPAFSDPLHVGRPNVGDRDRLLERISGILDSGWLTNDGPLVREFEGAVASLLGVRHCVATCNGTIALQIATRAAGLRGEVIVPSFTFVATAHALLWQGMKPVFCDVDPETHTLDPRRVEELVGERTSGILGVHLWGRPCAVDALTRIADRHGLILLFDAAHAFGCSFDGRPIGGFGAAEVLSFHATKVVNAFEGGAVVTNDDELAGRARLLRNFGFVDYDSVAALGTNGKMSEASAAMGLTSLEARERFLAVNRRNHEAYRRGLAGLAGLRLHEYEERQAPNWHYVVLEVDAEIAGLSRDLLLRVLWAENVLARRYFSPGCHRLEPYRSMPDEPLLPVTQTLAERVLVLPTGTAVAERDVAIVCHIIRAALGQASHVRSRLEEDPP